LELRLGRGQERDRQRQRPQEDAEQKPATATTTAGRCDDGTDTATEQPENAATEQPEQDGYFHAFLSIRRRAAIAAVLAATSTGTGINTAYIERLNATFRASLAPLVRRGRAIAHTEAVLTAGMWLVGCAYNFCWLHDSLCVAAPRGASWKWQERTPAMAAGLVDHRWTMRELLCYQVPLRPWVAPKRRGRPPKRTMQLAPAVAA
jgi:hypothetical protein